MYTGLGNQGATNTGQMIHIYIHIPTIISHAEAILMFNEGLAHACPNNKFTPGV